MKHIILIDDQQHPLKHLEPEVHKANEYKKRYELILCQTQKELDKTIEDLVLKRMRYEEDIESPAFLFDHDLSGKFPTKDGCVLAEETKYKLKKLILKSWSGELIRKKLPRFYLYSSRSKSKDLLRRAIPKLSGYFTLDRSSEILTLLDSSTKFVCTEDFSIPEKEKAENLSEIYRDLPKYFEIENYLPSLILYAQNLPPDEIRKVRPAAGNDMTHLRDKCGNLAETLEMEDVFTSDDRKDGTTRLVSSTNPLLLAIALEIPEVLKWLETRFGLQKIR